MANPHQAPRDLVLLTATINPPSQAHKLARRDPDLRRQDYLTAWRHYLQSLASYARLVFIENSGADLTEFHNLAAAASCTGTTAEVISLDLNSFPPHWGRAYGEFLLLHHARPRLDISNDAKIWKVTGRIVVSNLPAIIHSSPADFDLYCDCRCPPWHFLSRQSRGWMDMRLFATSRSFFDAEIVGRYPQMRHHDTGVPEIHLFHRIQQWRTTYTVVPRFRRTPMLRGHAGFDNKSYSSPRQRFIMTARWCLRGAAPWIWV